MRSFEFWLGVWKPVWLTRSDAPMMLSYRSLRNRTRLEPALGEWVQDSGGFTELSLHGGYLDDTATYARRTRLHAERLGRLRWAAVQDWMCEDAVLERTGLQVADHQQRTLESYLDLRELAPDLPWMPVLQGQHFDDYRRHLEAYDRAGVDLRAQPVVGLGTVCRRQHTLVAVRLVQQLRALGLRLHGFGLKVTSLLRLGGEGLASADSMSWSLDGRYPQGGRCRPDRRHKRCNNCLDWALRWRLQLLARLERQPRLWEDACA